jgi:hypothetical protein
VKIADFGIAIDATSDGLTRPGTTIGSPPYIAPEQLLGERVDSRGDLFGLGVVLYELLTGAPPYREPAPGETTACSRIQRGATSRCGGSRRHAARWLARLVRARSRCRARPASAQRVRQLLERKLRAFPGGRAVRAGELALGDRPVPSARGRRSRDRRAARADAGGRSGAGSPPRRVAHAVLTRRRCFRGHAGGVWKAAAARRSAFDTAPNAPARLRFEIDQRMRVRFGKRRRPSRQPGASLRARPGRHKLCSSGRAARTPSSSWKPPRAKSSGSVPSGPRPERRAHQAMSPQHLATRIATLISVLLMSGCKGQLVDSLGSAKSIQVSIYRNGRPVIQREVAANSETVVHVKRWAEANQDGWRTDMRTYAPGILLSSPISP